MVVCISKHYTHYEKNFNLHIIYLYIIQHTPKNKETSEILKFLNKSNFNDHKIKINHFIFLYEQYLHEFLKKILIYNRYIILIYYIYLIGKYILPFKIVYT